MSDALARSTRLVRERRDWLVPVAFAGLVVATYLLGIALGTLLRGEPALLAFVFEPLLYPFLFVAMPPVFAAINTLRGGSVPSSLAIGLVPGLTFPVLGLLSAFFGLGQGDAPAWALSLFFGGVGFLGALVGIGAAVGASYLSRTRLE